MVKITAYKKRVSEEGKDFFILEVQGGIEMIKSTNTGKFYATAKKMTIPCTFDENTCLSLIGSELQGKIVKQECESYTHTIQETGEAIEMNHTFVFLPEEETKSSVPRVKNDRVLVADPQVFSNNEAEGVYANV